MAFLDAQPAKTFGTKNNFFQLEIEKFQTFHAFEQKIKGTILFPGARAACLSQIFFHPSLAGEGCRAGTSNIFLAVEAKARDASEFQGVMCSFSELLWGLTKMWRS